MQLKKRREESQETAGEHFKIFNGIEECEEVSEKSIFELLDLENKHPSFQILNDEIIQAVNPSSHINKAYKGDWNFGDSRILVIQKVFKLRRLHLNNCNKEPILR